MGRKRPIAEVCWDLPTVVAKYPRGLCFLRSIVVSSLGMQRNTFRLVYLWGEPGSGKTTAVRARWPEAYWLTESREGWMGTYDGQGTVLCHVALLLHLLTAVCSRNDRHRRLLRYIPSGLRTTTMSTSAIRRSDKRRARLCGCDYCSHDKQSATGVLVSSGGESTSLVKPSGDSQTRSSPPPGQRDSSSSSPMDRSCSDDSGGDDGGDRGIDPTCTEFESPPATQSIEY